MKITIKAPSVTQLRKLKQGSEIRVKNGDDVVLECKDVNMFEDIKKCFNKGKTYTILYNTQTNIIISSSKNSSTKQQLIVTDDNIEQDIIECREESSEESSEDKEIVEKILKIIDTINSADEYMNFSNTLFDNEDKFKDKTILSTIMTLKTLKSNTPYLISYNQYHMISVEILKNLKKII